MSDHHSPQTEPQASTTEPPLVWAELGEIRRQLSGATGLLFGTDFDGTLSPIADDPEAPALTESNRQSLQAFRDHPQVRPAVISGRGLADLQARVDLSGVDYVGNHGLELAIDGSRETHPDAADVEPVITEVCDILDDRLADIEGTVVENKGPTATIHYRLVDRAAVETVETHVRTVVGDYADEIEIHDGKESLELRPAADWDKGSALLELREHVDDWLPFYIGDDTTDEAAFRAIGMDGITVHVGDNESTAAAYRVRSSAEAEAFIRWLATDGLAVLASSAEEST